MNKKYVNNHCQADGVAYSLTTEDIVSYLASKQDGEPVGVPNNSEECLIARTFQWKYPSATDVVVERLNILLDDRVIIPLSEQVQGIIDIFDDIELPYGIPATKQVWLEAMARADVYREVFGEAVIR